MRMVIFYGRDGMVVFIFFCGGDVDVFNGCFEFDERMSFVVGVGRVGFVSFVKVGIIVNSVFVMVFCDVGVVVVVN